MQYMNTLYLDTLACNLDRHSYSYGFLRNPGTGELVSMAPNFDHNLSLISSGAESSPLDSSPLLIQSFVKLLKHAGGAYAPPRQLTENEIREVTATTLPGEPVDREYAAEFLIERQRILFEHIAKM